MKKLGILIMALLSANIFGAPQFRADPSLKVKKLPNMMTVAVMKNSEPPNRVSMRLLVRRGSAHETEAERGLAHFIEHMAFNGTTHFPEGSMVEYFQRLGMAFGADTNAHTSFTETVYKLDMPEVSNKLLDDGMLLLRDYCDGMLFEPSAINKERGVIIAEMKARDTNEYRKAVKEIAHYFKGSIFGDRMPIGLEKVVNGAQKSDFENFYRANYKPENTVLVVVGDVDCDKIFALAEKTFSSFTGDKNFEGRQDNFGSLEISNEIKSIIEGAELDADSVYDQIENSPKSYASVAVSKQNTGEDSLEKRIEDMRIQTALYAVNARYIKVSDTPGSAITNGSAGMFDFSRFCRTIIFNAESPITKSSEALAENFRQILGSTNISEAEFDAAKKKLFQQLESAIASKSTRNNRNLANEIVSAFSDGIVFTSPEDDLQIAKFALENFSAADAVKLLKREFSGAKIKIFLSDSKAEIPQNELEKIVSDTFAAAQKSPHDPAKFEPGKLVFADFGAPGKIESESEVADLGIKMLLFQNGIRLNVKRTDFKKDEIRFKISFGNGMLDIPGDKPEYFVALYALTAGGTKFQSAAEISAALYNMKASLGASISGNSFEIFGVSTRKDFDSIISLAATTVSNPGFREDGEDSLAKFGEAFYRDYLTNPSAKLTFGILKLLDSPIEKVLGTLENFKKIKMPEIRDWLTPILRSSYMEISIVGDIDEKEAIDKIAKTFGAMPPREKVKKNPFAQIKRAETGKSVSLKYLTKDEPRSIAAKLWFSCGRQDPHKMRIANLLSSIFDDVMRKDIREAEGKVYSPFAYNNPSTWIKDYGLLIGLSFVTPEYNREVMSLIEKCAEKTAASITMDEFERAKIPLLKEVEANMRKNVYWLETVLNLCQAKPENIELAKTIRSGYSEITLEDVQNAAKEIFGKKPYEITIMPDAEAK